MKKLLLPVFLFALSAVGYAQTGNIYPRPQVITTLSNDISVDKPIIKVIKPSDKAYNKYKNKIKNITGAYYLKTNKNNVTIVAYDDQGEFYAMQTLAQMYVNKMLPQVEITDYPDVKYRGVVEGFYGTPWSHADRLDLLAFYGKHKMNTYIYGPKDDPYHSSPSWRKPYPTNQAKQIVELVDAANANKVDFVWAIHPGKDIKWNETDRDSLIMKFEMMYELGVRSYAVFFDDISGEGTNPIKQSELLNYIYDAFMRKKTDAKQLIICPTEYNKSWSNPAPGTYLDILGDSLYPEIEIMWTGNRVISDMTEESMEWINKRLKRKAYIWWNFPVSDYVRNHLLLGQVYGNSRNIKDEMAGFMTNPMEHAQASKLAIFSVADYSWNVANYDSLQSWRAAIREVMPKSADAFEIFASHNSDLGVNGHLYRRKESEHIIEAANSFKLDYKLNAVIDKKHFNELLNEYELIEKAPSIIKGSNDNPQLIKEINPWLLQFEQIGKSGQCALNMLDSLNQTNYEGYWQKFQELTKIKKEINRINDSYNRNPYQPGVKSASLVLKPLIDSLATLSADYFYSSLAGVKLTERKTSLTPILEPKFDSKIGQLKNQPLLIEGNIIKISPLLEVVRINPHADFKIQLPYPIYIEEITTDFGDKEVYSWLQCEATDEQDNKQILVDVNGIYSINNKVTSIAFKSKADKRMEFNLKQVELTTALNIGSKDDISPIFDKNLATSYSLDANQAINIQVSDKNALIIVTEEKSNLIIEQFFDGNLISNNSLLQQKTINQLQLNAKTNNVSITNTNNSPIHIVEVIMK